MTSCRYICEVFYLCDSSFCKKPFKFFNVRVPICQIWMNKVGCHVFLYISRTKDVRDALYLRIVATHRMACLVRHPVNTFKFSIVGPHWTLKWNLCFACNFELQIKLKTFLEKWLSIDLPEAMIKLKTSMHYALRITNPFPSHYALCIMFEAERVYLEWYLPAVIAPLYGQNEHYGAEFC